MARRKTTPATGTAIVPVTDEPVLLNAERNHDPANPHSWLPLIGDPPGTSGLRIMWGVLRARYHNVENSAAAFVVAKLRPSWSADPHAVTAAWSEALAPADSDDSLADPMLLAARIDREIARDAGGTTALLGYATITDPEANRIHTFREELRAVARQLVESHGCAVIAVVHAPGRAGSGNPMHGHLCLSPYVVDGPLGFSKRIPAFCDDRGRQVILDAWRGRRRFV